VLLFISWCRFDTFWRKCQAFFCRLDNEPVKFVLLFGLPKNQLQTHLGTLASIPKFLNDRSVRADLVKADSDGGASLRK